MDFFLTYHERLCFRIMVSDFKSKSISVFFPASSFILAPAKENAVMFVCASDEENALQTGYSLA